MTTWLWGVAWAISVGTGLYLEHCTRQLRKENKELKRVTLTQFRILRDDHEIVSHTFQELYRLTIEPGAMTPSGKHWNTLDTAYGTMKIYTRTPAGQRLNRWDEGKRKNG